MLEGEVQSMEGGPSNGVQASTSQSPAMTETPIPDDVPDAVSEVSEPRNPPPEDQSMETNVSNVAEGHVVEGQAIESQAIEGQVNERQSSQTIRAEPLADRHNLSWWFPQIDHDEKESWRIWLSRRSRALMLQIGITVLVLVVNFTLTFIVFSRYPSMNGVGLIYSGDCNTVARLDQWIHLLINVMSTGMLSASNYCMQLQAAPTRADVDAAHRRNRWLDIGIPSLRNLGQIRGWRLCGWLFLAFSSVPLHLLYNSAVFQSLASNEYTIAVVADSFLNGTAFDLVAAERNREGDWGWDDDRVNPPQNYTDIIQHMQQKAMSGVCEELNITACFGLYDDYWTPQGNGLVFVKNESARTVTDESLLMYVSIVPRSDDWAKNMWALGNGTGKFVAVEPDSPVISWYLGPPHYEVSHCLVEPRNTTASRCRFEYSPQIMITVCVLNLIKATVMVCIWVIRKWQRRDSPGQTEDEKQRVMEDQVLYTLGDAIASFMRNPDPTTERMCLAPREDFLQHRAWANKLRKQDPKPSQEPRDWPENTKRRWMSSASLKRWSILLLICGIILGVASGLLGIAKGTLGHRKIDTTISGFWKLGFGQLTPVTYLVLGLPQQDPAGLISNVLIANMPQLLVTVIYLFYNSMLSTFLVQREFSLMHKPEKRKPLRVSEPMGIQRSSYFISLPLRYGIPLYATSGLMHWLVSQSLFLARITAVDPDGQDDSKHSFSTCGYSPIATFITILVGIALVVGIIGLGARTYDGTMSMVSTNSRAISAACHALEGDRENGYLLPVQWGVVQVKGDVGRCAFTTAPDHELQKLRNLRRDLKFM